MARDQINIRVGPESLADWRQTAEECGLTVGEWARIVLDHAAGRVELSQQLERAAEAGNKLFSAALGETLAKLPRKRTLAALLVDTETGEEAVYGDEHWHASPEGTEFIWTEGGMSCACNRAPIFGHPTPCCTSTRYQLTSLTLDGVELLTPPASALPDPLV